MPTLVSMRATCLLHGTGGKEDISYKVLTVTVVLSTRKHGPGTVMGCSPSSKQPSPPTTIPSPSPLRSSWEKVGELPSPKAETQEYNSTQAGLLGTLQPPGQE